MRILPIFSALALSACSTIIAGTGETTTGKPVSGQFVVTPSANGPTFNVSFLSSSQATCSGQFTRAPNQLISSFPVTCTNGRTGTASFTSDFINYRDTLIYQLNNGESGRVVFGATMSLS